MKNVITSFESFINENNTNDFDRSKLKSDLFSVNVFDKKVDLNIIDHKKVDTVMVFDNSVVFYDKKTKTPIDEIKNISSDTNEELVKIIEDRLKSLK